MLRKEVCDEERKIDVCHVCLICNEKYRTMAERIGQQTASNKVMLQLVKSTRKLCTARSCSNRKVGNF